MSTSPGGRREGKKALPLSAAAHARMFASVGPMDSASGLRAYAEGVWIRRAG
ncbi:hypothetical protein [Streptomyces sp. NPDC047043]|uniref:hypothetical protein n=1 Tax=Streptomyces sp. NPDC047043 TaxID=3154497 RepID=UPI0033DFE277